MIKILKYFFYRIYSFSLSNGESDAGWAYAIVSMFLIANIYTLLDVIIIITKSILPQLNNLSIIFMGVGVLYFNYILLLKNGKAKEISKTFRNSKENKTFINVALLVYIIISVFAFIFTGNIVRSMKY